MGKIAVSYFVVKIFIFNITSTVQNVHNTALLRDMDYTVAKEDLKGKHLDF